MAHSCAEKALKHLFQRREFSSIWLSIDEKTQEGIKLGIALLLYREIKSLSSNNKKEKSSNGK